MDYEEEQRNELEALSSIYLDEYTLLSSDPASFTIRIKSEANDVLCDGDEVVDGLECSLKITYTSNYPDSLPIIEIVDSENLTDLDEEDIVRNVTEFANENLGMAMVFSYVTCVQEYLNKKWDNIKKDKEEEAERRLKEADEEERKRFEGTRVTVESFLAWKHAFEEELGIYKKIKEKDSKKLTGRELFMQDQTLNESDLKFLEAGDQVAVDESLFQDLDDLALEDELSDEE